MKPRTFAIGALVVAALFTGFHVLRSNAIGQQPAPGGASNVPKWEYKVVPTASDLGGVPGDQEQLNKLGAEGWELISGLEKSIFKRPLK